MEWSESKAEEADVLIKASVALLIAARAQAVAPPLREGAIAEFGT